MQSIDASQVVSISVIDSDPTMAANIANTTAKVFKEEIPNIIGFNDVQLLSEAKVVPYPINDSRKSDDYDWFYYWISSRNWSCIFT